MLIASGHDVALAIRNVAPISSQDRCTILLMLLWPLAIDRLLIEVHEIVHKLLARAVFHDIRAAVELQPRVSGPIQERAHTTRDGICHRLDAPGLANEPRFPFFDQLRDSADIRADDRRAGSESLNNRIRHVLSTSRTRNGERRPLDIRLQRPTGLIAGELDTRSTAQRRRERLEIGGIWAVADYNQAHVLWKARQGGIEGSQQRIDALLDREPSEEQEVWVLSVGRIRPGIRRAVEDRVVGEVLQEDDLALGPAALDELGAHETGGRDYPVDPPV